MPVSYARLEPWAPHKLAAPRTARDGDRLLTAANGTRACAGEYKTQIQ